MADALRRAGWTILDRNARLPGGELDIVAERSGVVAVVEVRARRLGGSATPVESVTPAKREALRRTGDRWIRRRGVDGVPVRYLLASVDLDAAGGIVDLRIEPLDP